MFRRWFRVKSWRDDEYLREAQRKAQRANPNKSTGERMEEIMEDGAEYLEME